MDPHRPVRCPDNAALALHLLRKRQDLASSSSSAGAGAGAISENLDLVLTNAHRSICAHKSSITSLKDLSQIKGVGKWILRMMKGFFPNDEPSPVKKGRQAKGPKRYAPQKNSVSYALLITLYREMKNGVTFMKKQELIDAAEASGLARTSIGPDKAKAKPSQMNSARDWYTGWNCMKTLISKGLVVKSSCPAKLDACLWEMESGLSGIDSLTKNLCWTLLLKGKTSMTCAVQLETNRYRDQKLRLQRCGLKKLIYLVEGDLNSLEAAESLKTACFTTEILEGFDIQRTTGFADTVRRYGHLTQSIFHYCCTYFPSCKTTSSRVCPLFVDFVKKCQDLEKMTVRDVFALQLMQVPQVTEDIALAVVDLYPTILSLARAYSLREGDLCAQEEMLKNQNRIISGVASRNIYKLVWG